MNLDPNRRVIHDRGSCDPGGAVEATSSLELGVSGQIWRRKRLGPPGGPPGSELPHAIHRRAGDA
jgi:hypothetical protein